MSDWNPALYLKFGNERTQPARDLLQRIEAAQPARVLDVGCGPGNSTALLAERWPDADVTGVDSSAGMLEQACKAYPRLHWIEKDAGSDMSDLGAFDVVFSNAALQWIPDHERLIPHLFSLLKPGGILAVQVPDNNDSPLHTAVRETARSSAWSGRISSHSAQIYDPPETYYSLLAPLTDHLHLWQTIYHHIMDSHEHLIDWSRATYMRTYVDQLDSDEAKKAFERDVLHRIMPAYPPQANGKILFPFKRLFFVTRKTD